MGFKFYNIWIVQSIPHGQWSTGRHLFHALRELPGVEEHVLIEEPYTKAEFLEVLSKIDSDLKLTGRIPLLHIEAHGDEKGLQLASGEHIPWLELRASLQSINFACRNNLLVVLAACFGENLININNSVTERCPIWGCIGPIGDIPAGDLHDSFKAFYAFFLCNPDLREGIQVLNGAVEGTPYSYRLWTAELIFCQAFIAYLEEQCSSVKLSERRDFILGAVVRSGSRVTASIEADIEAKLRNHQHYFERFKGHFLMEDLDPSNAQRFTLQFSDVARCLDSRPRSTGLLT